MVYYIIKITFPTLFASRQQEIEEKLIEEETARRVEELVAKRVEEELEKRKDEIEREVLRRVEEAKRIMEKQLLGFIQWHLLNLVSVV